MEQKEPAVGVTTCGENAEERVLARPAFPAHVADVAGLGPMDANEFDPSQDARGIERGQYEEDPFDRSDRAGTAPEGG